MTAERGDVELMGKTASLLQATVASPTESQSSVTSALRQPCKSVLRD